MSSAALDTLAYAKRLRDAGVPVAQAEAHAEAARDFVSGDLATKADLAALEAAIDRRFASVDHRIESLEQKLGSVEQKLEEKIGSVEQKLEHKIGSLERSLDHKIQSIEQRLVLKLGAMLVVGFAALGTILRLT